MSSRVALHPVRSSRRVCNRGGLSTCSRRRARAFSRQPFARPKARRELDTANGQAGSPTDSTTRQFAEVDWLKAVGILVVVLIHTVRSPWEFGASPTELWIGRITRFAVPGFLMASGFLYATRQSVPLAKTRGRLLRVLVPYLVFSAAAQALEYLRGPAPSAASVVSDLVFASSFGPYYYVFVATTLVAVAPLLARLAPRTLALLLVPELAVQAYLEIYGELSLFWQLRNPLFWLPYFQVGWMARLAHPRLENASALARNSVVAVCLAGSLILFALVASDRPPAVLQALDWLAIWTTLGAMFFWVCGRRGPAPGGVVTRTLSDATYPMYLAHLFFLGPLRSWMAPASGVFEPAAIFVPWAASLVLSLALVYLGRAVLGRYSRTWLGA